METLIDRVPSTPSTAPLVIDEDQVVSSHIVANPAVAITMMAKSQRSAGKTTPNGEHLSA